MDKRHISIIERNLTDLVNKTNLDLLKPKLLSSHVFSQTQLNRMLNDGQHNNDEKLMKTSLFLAVTKRGPKAFTGLASALLESNHVELASMLLRAETDTRDPPRDLSIAMPPSPPAEDSPDSSPTHHCRIDHEHSTHVFQLPAYLDRDLRHAFKDGHTRPEDMVNLSDQAGPTKVSVRHAEVPQLSDDGLPKKYSMVSNPRGYALIINNVDFEDCDDYPTRNGAPNDEHAMASLLRQLYFTVESHTNKTKQEMVLLVEAFANKAEWATVDCAFVVLMSHGKEGDSEEDTEIVGTDGMGLKTRDVLGYFYNDSCPLLLNKPKIFIFQSCRGALTDNGVTIDRFGEPHSYYHRTETDGRMRHQTIRSRSRSDVFVAHPVPPGIKANRDRYKGAWFIQTIVEVFSQYASITDLEDLFKIVDHRIKQMINFGDPNYQTVTTRTIGWNKKLYFNPGLSFVNGRLVRESPVPPPMPDDEGMDVVDNKSARREKKQDDLQRLTPNEKEDDEMLGCFRCRPS